MQSQDSEGSRTARVLVVDDDPAVTSTLAKTFALEGFSVAVAHNGVEALDRVTEAPPAVVVLDLQMPIMDGVEFLAALRGPPWNSTAPVVLVSGSDVANARRRTQGMGVILLMPKPLDLDTLIETVVRLTRSSREEAQ